MAFDSPQPDLLIAGASARAAAFSAVRGGLTVACADLFGDADLAAIAEVTAITDWPHGIEPWAHRFPPTVPLIYVGGLENEPELLAGIAAHLLLLGLLGPPLALARSPEYLACLFADAGIGFPEIARPEDVPAGERWLVKRRRGAAGRGVRFWKGTDDRIANDCYLQRYVDGIPGAAAFLATGQGVEFLGATESLLPDEALLSDQTPFAYVGSVTTDRFPSAVLRWIGGSLARVGIDGLFGVDFIYTESPDGPRVTPVEVNPRYTAGMEVLELRSNRAFVADYARSFFGYAPRSATELADGLHCGKRIVYAPRALRVCGLVPPTRLEMFAGDYSIADVPTHGTVVPAGAPVCTVFARAGSPEECRRLLKEAEREVSERCEMI